MNIHTQAIQQLEQHFSLVRNYWLQQKERGLGAIYLALDGSLDYRTHPEIPDDTFGSLYAKLALKHPNTHPSWILVVVEIEKCPHRRFSWQLLAIDEREKIRIFSFIPFGFRNQDTQTTVFIGQDRTIIEHATPEGIESVEFFSCNYPENQEGGMR